MVEESADRSLTPEQVDKLSKLGLQLPRQKWGAGSVTKRGKHYSGQFWSYEVQPDGTERRVHRTVTLGLVNSMTKADAKLKLQARIRKETSIPSTADASMTLRQFWEERYLPLKELVWKSTNAEHEKYMRTKYIIEPLGHIPLNKLDKLTFSRELNSLASHGYSKSVIKKFRTNSNALLEEAEEQIRGFRNPIRKLQMPKTPDESKRRLTLDELHDLLDALSPRDSLILRIFFVIGLRPSELFALRRNDVETNPPLLRIDEANVPKGITDTKTRGAKAPIYLPTSLAQDLSAWMKSMHDQRPEAFLFPSKRDTPIATHNFLRRNLKAAAEGVLASRRKVGIKIPDGYLQGVNHQALRRTCATYAGSKGVGTVKDAQAILRHSTPDMTATVYMQAIPESVKQTLEALDAKLRKKRRVQN